MLTKMDSILGNEHSRRTIICFLLSVFCLVCTLSYVGSTDAKEPAHSPNIILILTDDQGWTSVSHRSDPNIPSSKSDFYETPNIDKLAQSGVLFTQGYAPNPICSPSRNSLLLGQNAARHIYNKDADWYKKTDDWFTIPRILKKANPEYRTAHLGKWHIAMVPGDAGFDYHEGMTSNAGGEIFDGEFLNFRKYSGLLKKFLAENKVQNHFNMTLSGKGSYYWSDNNPKDVFGITRRAKNFMKQSIASGKPFYVQLSHYATHVSLVSRAETYKYFQEKLKGNRHTNPEFAAMLKDLDTGVGELLDFIKEQGIENNTYVFLMGDNGGTKALHQLGIINSNKELVDGKFSQIHHRNFPLRDGKHSFYEGGLRVPFMAAGPGIEANRVSATPVSGLDLLPTFAELAGFEKELPDVIDGGSLLPLLYNENRGKVDRNRESLIFHQSSHRPPRSAIRKGDFKLIKYWSKDKKYKKTPKVELYDLSSDIGETVNLVKEFPLKAKQLEEELLLFLNEVNAETGVRDIDGAFYRLKNDLELEN